MSVTETRQLYDPQLTGSRKALLASVDKLGAGLASQLSGFTGLDTSKYAPQIADRTDLQKGLAAQAKGLESLVGPGMALPAGVEAGSIEAYMSPYQQQVMDATLAEFDRNAAIENQGLRDAAISRGAFGGGNVNEGAKRMYDLMNNLEARA